MQKYRAQVWVDAFPTGQMFPYEIQPNQVLIVWKNIRRYALKTNPAWESRQAELHRDPDYMGWDLGGPAQFTQQIETEEEMWGMIGTTAGLVEAKKWFLNNIEKETIIKPELKETSNCVWRQDCWFTFEAMRCFTAETGFSKTRKEYEAYLKREFGQ